MPSRPPHRPSTREAMLEAAEAHLRRTGLLSLETAARAAGVTKAGLMYHFATKKELMEAVLDRVVDRYQEQLAAYLRAATGISDLASATARQRLAAYVRWTCEVELDACDLVMFTDPRLREPLTERWTERLEPWLAVPTVLPAEDQARMLAARLVADGAWFANASGTLPMTSDQKAGVLRVALELMDVPS